MIQVAWQPVGDLPGRNPHRPRRRCGSSTKRKLPSLVDESQSQAPTHGLPSINWKAKLINQTVSRRRARQSRGAIRPHQPADPALPWLMANHHPAPATALAAA